MTGASLLGPWPGADQHEAQATVLGELSSAPEGVTGVPPLVQVPGRGPWALPLARAAGLLTDMPVELGPHGWRLADRPGRDLERIHAARREELDVLAVTGFGYVGPLALTLPGPWSTAATLYLARGDRVLSDVGAVRELLASLGDGLGTLLTAVRGAVPGAEPVVVLSEWLLPEVLGGGVPTFSGHGYLRSVPGERVSAGLTAVVDAARAAGAGSVVVHGGERFAGAPGQVLARSGADAVGVTLGSLRGAQWEQVAALVEEGVRLWLGLPGGGSGQPVDPAQLAASVLRPWTGVGLPVERVADVVVHAGSAVPDAALPATGEAARAALAATVRVAAHLADRAAGG